MIDLRMQLEDALFDIWPHEARALQVAAAIKKASPDDQELFVRWASEIGLVPEFIDQVWQAAAAARVAMLRK